MNIAFFDFDKTLIAVNSGSLFIKLLWKEKRLTKGQLASALLGLAKYHFGFSDLGEKFQEALKSLKGQHSEEIAKKVARFYWEEVRHLYRPGALDALAAHRALGDKIVLLTSGPHPFAQVVSNDLCLDHCLCTTLEIDTNGHFTGNTVGPTCYGHGKLTLAEEFAKGIGVELSKCTFYTDSASDMPVMHQVGQAVAVNPDPVLRKTAQQKGWKIVDWGTP